MSDQDVPKSDEQVQNPEENEIKEVQEMPETQEAQEIIENPADEPTNEQKGDEEQTVIEATPTAEGENVQEESVEPRTEEPGEPSKEPGEATEDAGELSEQPAEEREATEEADGTESLEVPETEGETQAESTEPQEEGEQTADEQQEPKTEEGEPVEGDVLAGIQETTSDKLDVESTAATEDVEDEDAHPLDEFTDQQVIDLVQEIETENRHLQLENNLFESFLKDNDPSLLEGLDEIMSAFIGRESESFIGADDESVKRLPSNFDKAKYKLDSYTSITSIAEGKGPKINLSQKTDMVMRAMEESQTSLEAFLKKCHITKRNLKSELEEFSIREAEIKEATEIFEYNVVIQGVDKLTQRIPAEKFIRYMEEWLKSAQLQIEKLRLRIATLKVQYKKVSQQLIQRQELGENVHAVDFDQLEIENKHFVEKIEQKNVHLIELKKMNGGANLILSTHKKFLQKQQEECNKLKQEIAEKNKEIEITEKECEQAEEELEAEIEKYDNCRNLKNQYTVPDVMDYVRLKAKLHEVRKNIKIWIRRRKIQDIALNTCLREMKNLTGMTEIDPSWFEDSQSISEATPSDDMLR